MAEKLVTLRQVCQSLSISRATFYKIRAGLIADGLEEVLVASVKGLRFRESSVNKLIINATKSGKPIGGRKGVQHAVLGIAS
jgi:predicted site-specific integrase-resolvase